MGDLTNRQRSLIGLGLALLITPFLFYFYCYTSAAKGEARIFLRIFTAIDAAFLSAFFIGSMGITTPIVKAGFGFAMFALVFLYEPGQAAEDLVADYPKIIRMAKNKINVLIGDYERQNDDRKATIDKLKSDLREQIKNLDSAPDAKLNIGYKILKYEYKAFAGSMYGQLVSDKEEQTETADIILKCVGKVRQLISEIEHQESIDISDSKYYNEVTTWIISSQAKERTAFSEAIAYAIYQHWNLKTCDEFKRTWNELPEDIRKKRSPSDVILNVVLHNCNNADSNINTPMTSSSTMLLHGAVSVDKVKPPKQTADMAHALSELSMAYEPTAHENISMGVPGKIMGGSSQDPPDGPP